MFRVRTKHFCFDASCLLVNKTNKPLHASYCNSNLKLLVKNSNRTDFFLVVMRFLLSD